MNLYFTELPHPQEPKAESGTQFEVSPTIDRINQVLEALEVFYAQRLAEYDVLMATEYTQEKLEKMGQRDYESACDLIDKVSHLRGLVRDFRNLQAQLIVIGFKKMMTEEDAMSDLSPAEAELQTLVYYFSYQEFNQIVIDITSLLRSAEFYNQKYEWMTPPVSLSLTNEFSLLRSALFGDRTQRPRKRRSKRE